MISYLYYLLGYENQEHEKETKNTPQTYNSFTESKEFLNYKQAFTTKVSFDELLTKKLKPTPSTNKTKKYDPRHPVLKELLDTKNTLNNTKHCKSLKI